MEQLLGERFCPVLRVCSAKASIPARAQLLSQRKPIPNGSVARRRYPAEASII
jgi:hypothetical protein